MRRILVLGPCGSGKSTLARQLAGKLGLPAHHMDVLSWKPGWVSCSDAELTNKLKKVIQGKSWVIDGNYGKFLEMRLKRADTIVYLDINKWICRWRVIKRWLTWHGRQRPDMGVGCPEKIDWEFFMWVWNFDRTKTIEKISKLGNNIRVFRLRNSNDVKSFMGFVKGAKR